MDWLQGNVFYSGLGLRSDQQFIIFTQNTTLSFLFKIFILQFRFPLIAKLIYLIKLPAAFLLCWVASFANQRNPLDARVGGQKHCDNF